MSTIEMIRKPGFARTMVPAIAASALAVVISLWLPYPGPLLLGLLFGALVANFRHTTSEFISAQMPAAKLLLQLGVVLLGLKLPLDKIVTLGPRGAAVVIVTVTVTFTLSRWFGKQLGLDHGLVTLVASGFSICGAAAIAAVSDVVKSKEKDVAMAVAMVTIFGGAMIGVVPWLASALGLTDVQSAVWAGASIHEVAQVAAAASLIGGNAVALAMLIKLGRVSTLAAVCWAAGRNIDATDDTDKPPALPWFIIGFALMSIVRTVVPFGDTAVQISGDATNLLLAAGMFGLGLGLRFKDLWPVPPRLLVLAASSTAVALVTSLTLVLAIY